MPPSAYVAEHSLDNTDVGQQVTTVSETVPTAFKLEHAVMYPTGQIPGE